MGNVIDIIISVPLEDGVVFRVKRIFEMEESEYPGVRVIMETEFDKVITPLKIDISTGDVITPKEVRYSFKLMLEDRTIDVWAYNLETVLAEKLETIIRRGLANTRMRDFYDIYILQQIYGDSISSAVLYDALNATSGKRGSLEFLEDAADILNEVEENPIMEKLWLSYQKSFSYTADISWHIIMDSVRALYILAK